MKFTRLPDLMDELELSEFTTMGGVKLKLAENIRGSIPAATAEDAFAWLEEHGHDRLIKRTFQIEFGKDQEAWANKFERDCAQRKRQLNIKRKKGVHPQSLHAFVREQLEEGVAIPMQIFGVFRQRYVRVTLPK